MVLTLTTIRLCWKRDSEMLSASPKAAIWVRRLSRATHIGRVNKQLVRLEIEARDPPSARSKLKSNDVEAGFITSAAFSPGLGKVACLAYANRDFAKEGARLAVEQEDGPISAVITKVL